MPLRGRITWGDACAAMPRVKSHVPSSPSALTTPPPLSPRSPLPFHSRTWLKTALKKHIKTLLWCHGRQLTPRVQNYRLLGMWHILDGLGGKCGCDCSGGVGGGLLGLCDWGGWVYCLFVLKQATSLMKWCRGRFETTHFCQFEK